ncbi:RNA polymerase sigma factor [Phaeodactylibacter luteus]|uniref:Sigma-70 family RNA polymerase sigma factor n=1 Tax=Phaeodactylibacter luteus TaxID=1564516 RepID=A0A5C6RSA6_9BACT|nr:sigma-70 family RNA polymerase sigma factor [Phaeodactylibacter luteus]TXB64929.1 sigma-70 family RNA polymerase sigma factor [Phaeodactylibacter luteus]
MDLNTFKTDILPMKHKLYRVALRITNNPQEAEDVVQEAFIKVWEQRSSLSGIKSIEAWCTQMVKNRAIDKRRLRFNHAESLESAYSLSTPQHHPGQQAELADDMEQVSRLMQDLPENQRQAMQLRDIEGMTYQEIADQLQMPMPQVKTNIFRARKSLRQKLTALWTIK